MTHLHERRFEDALLRVLVDGCRHRLAVAWQRAVSPA
jgi:hypothetical protein